MLLGPNEKGLVVDTKHKLGTVYYFKIYENLQDAEPLKLNSTQKNLAIYNKIDDEDGNNLDINNENFANYEDNQPRGGVQDIKNSARLKFITEKSQAQVDMK